MRCSTKNFEKNKKKNKLLEELQPNHAYTVLGASEKEGKKFIKLKNPWAKGALRYTRVSVPNAKDILRAEENTDNGSGIFEVELNTFLSKTTNFKMQRTAGIHY